MRNSDYVKMAVDGLNIYIEKFPNDTGNLKYNATSLKDFRLTKEGASWNYKTSGTTASYAEAVNDGYEQYIFGKKTGRKVQGQFFYEKGVVRLSRFLQNRFKFGNLAGKRQAQSAKVANLDANLDTSARQLVMNRSVELVESGKVQLGSPMNRNLKVG